MNKNLKRIIALVLAIGAFSVSTPATRLNLLTTKVYAADNSTDTLSSLRLEKSSGSDIQLYSDSDYESDNKVDDNDVTKGDTYYAKTSTSKVKIEADGPDEKYVRVFKGTSGSTKGKELGDNISLSSDTTKLIVRIYSSEPDDDVRYGDDDNVIGTYTIKVECTSTSTSDDEDNSDSYDDIYLDKLSVNGDSISLSDSKTTYTYSVDNDVTEATIKAVPPDEDDDTYSVTIDGSDVNSDDKFKKTVDLSEGENEFKIKLEDDSDNEREYTLKITRESGKSAVAATNDSDSSKPNGITNPQAGPAPLDQKKSNDVATKIGWVQVNGGWQFYDSTGNLLKKTWYFDRGYGKWYFLGTDGMMSVNSWILTEGKYYYVGTDGAMATNTMIGQYKVGTDGAWIQ
ncbi:hypothetical protein B0P06_003152 [Clostridium saccharoperbutylacetonicum]|uniref:Cadherin-like beta-sandwich-like domain-containing protein n=2 Tax=Clostridium TaxID=1485 RepID=M1MV45_9CLOT|nr:cadherin-like beta sandwich domain-containing protein [Clostridium saccharoperbutylacetonicum]AGF58531.1 hypothetical protein Cspa_c47780 [Clostridium saccharoperbutylacetonicum N1-4(HMT)]NRT60691.1 hypothetical protein [Clostridium saccharoperbutylacetonicum]NSB24005.1 hypothetical protein [Clostridium saccharoperbutylacetonicum]NSB43381.1 hypothetical protein [Clostridium saccharoperbutylacetonicum]